MTVQVLQEIGDDPSLLLVDDDEPFPAQTCKSHGETGIFRGNGGISGRRKGNRNCAPPCVRRG